MRSKCPECNRNTLFTLSDKQKRECYACGYVEFYYVERHLENFNNNKKCNHATYQYCLDCDVVSRSSFNNILKKLVVDKI